MYRETSQRQEHPFPCCKQAWKQAELQRQPCPFSFTSVLLTWAQGMHCIERATDRQMTAGIPVSGQPWRGAHTAKEGQKSVGSFSLAEIPLKHHPNLSQNLPKIQDRHSPSEFNVSEEAPNVALGLCSCWGPHGVSVALVCVCYHFMQERPLCLQESAWPRKALQHWSAWEEKGDNLPCLVPIPERTTVLIAE